MRRPVPRGPLTAALVHVLLGRPGSAPDLPRLAARTVAADRRRGVAADDDVQLALTMLHELHYTGLDGVDPDWEWAPDLVAARRVLERAFEAELRVAVRDRVDAGCAAVARDAGRGTPVPDAVAGALFALADADHGPPLAAHLDRRATLGEFREFVVHRSVYHLKEADPHTWAVPRLTGRAKAALVEVQADEYGGGDPARMHSALFARTMRELGLDDAPGAYLDRLPATTLATVTAVSMFGLQRRLRAAVAGHLAALEMTSSVPNRRYGNGLRRLGFGERATGFYDEHVEADAVHEQVAGRDLAGGLVQAEPQTLPDVLFGAAVALELEARSGRVLLRAWRDAGSSLLPGAPTAPVGVPYDGDLTPTRIDW